jgi:cell division transport system ATP-binding protein
MSTDAPPTPPVPDTPPDRGRHRDRARGRRREREASATRADRRSMLRPGDGPMVILDGVTKRYDPNVLGLDDVSISIESGEFVFLVGPSGSGKSTFIRLLLKEFDVTEGTIIVGGRNLSTLRRSKVPYLRRAIGCVFQDFKLLAGRTVYDNVAYALQVIGENPRNTRRKVPEILALVGLSDKGDRFPNELSGGEQQRVSIARAFVNHPRLLIADEPTGNLDPETSIGIMQLLYRINRTGTTVIMATHDREMVDKMQMRVIGLEDGKVVRDQREGRYARADH